MSGRTVILAPSNAGRISLRNPDAVVIDVVGQVVWQDGKAWFVSTRGHRSSNRKVALGCLNFKFVVMLICGHGRLVSYDEIYHEFWGHSDEGGPLDPARYLYVLRNRAEPLFERIGLDVSMRYGKGFLPVLRDRLPMLARAA